MIAASPIGFYQLREIGVNEELLLVVMFIITLGLIVYLLLDTKISKSSDGDLILSEAFQQQSKKPNIITKLNYWLGVKVINLIVNKKSDLVWAILTPQTKLSLSAVFNVSFLGIFYFVMTMGDVGDKKFPIETMLIMFYPGTLLSVILEARNNISQTKTLAHIYSGERHQYLKNQILFIVDKTMLFTTLVYSFMAFLMIFILDIKIDIIFASIVVPAILIVTFAFSPLLMGLKWSKVTFSLSIITAIYLGTLILISLWINLSLVGEFSTFAIIVFIGSCIALRGFTESLFKDKSMEELLKSS